MPQSESKKRQLHYKDFDEMLADVEALQSGGYVRRGNWTLGQACGHVADWMRFPMDGFPKPPLPMRVVFWVMKMTVAPGMKRKILAEGFQGGMPTAPETVPDAEAFSDEQGIAKLRASIDRLNAWDRELIPSPLFGPMDKATLIRVSLLHGEHHFGYLEPESPNTMG